MTLNSKTTELKNRILDFFKKQPVIKSDSGYSAKISDIKIDIPKGATDLSEQMKIKYKSESLEGKVKGVLTIYDPSGSVLSKSASMMLLKFPLFTDRSTIISNGSEKFIQNQIRTKPGVYTTKGNSAGVARTEIKFPRISGGTRTMPSFNIVANSDKKTFVVEIKGSGKTLNVNVVNFMRELGFSDQEIASSLGNGSYSDYLFKRANSNYKSIFDIHRVIVGGTQNNLTPDAARSQVIDFLENNSSFESGQSVVQKNLGVSASKAKFLSRDVISKAVEKTMAVEMGDKPEDERDDIRNADILSDIDLIIENISGDYKEFEKNAKAELDNYRNLNQNSAKSFKSILNLGNNLNGFLTQSSVVHTVSEGSNPVAVESNQREITQFGDKYAPTTLKSGNNNDDIGTAGKRVLTLSEFNKIDPVEVPENAKLGLVQHLAQGAKVKNKTVYIDVYKVSGKYVKTDSSNKKTISVDDEYNSKIAFYDKKYITVDSKKGELRFNGPRALARYKGKVDEMLVSDIQYIDVNASNTLGTTANLVPFVSHDDGARIIMATSQQKQAVVLKNREEPVVSMLYDPKTKETYEEKMGKDYGKPVICDVNGKVTSISDSKIKVKDSAGKVYIYQYYNHYPFNGSYINNELKVSVGDEVKKGQMLAEGWQTKNGKLAIGLNANVMFLPYKGYNYEDGIVISQSLAKRMSSEETTEYEINIPSDCKGGRGSGILKEVSIYSSDPDLHLLDRDGIVKEGTYVKSGSLIAAFLSPVDTSNASVFDLVKSMDKNSKYVEKLKRIDSNSYIEGKIVRIVVLNNPDKITKQRIVFTISTDKPLKVGDKLSGRHGNKGTVTKILPDEQMPFSEDNVRADVLLSPLGVPSRKNVGQVLEVGAGLIKRKTGKDRVIENFDSSEKDKLLKDMEAAGLGDGRMKVYVPEVDKNGKIVNVPTEAKVDVGSMYMIKLKHKVDDKAQARSNLETSLSQKNYMPSKRVGMAQGEKRNPQALGEMEFKSLIGHGAVWNALESSTLKSDGGGNITNRLAIFNALKGQKINPDELDFAATPESFKLFADNLKALGLVVKPQYNGKDVKSFDDAYDSLALVPLKTKDFVKLVGKDKKVTSSNIYNAKNIKSGNAKGLEGGLYDPKIFGDNSEPDNNRNKWGYIELSSPVANPIFADRTDSSNIYALVTNMKASDIKAISEGKKVIVESPETFEGFKKMNAEERKENIKKSLEAMSELGVKAGDLVDPKILEKYLEKGVIIPFSAGGKAIYSALEKVDIKKELKKAQKSLDSAKGANIDKNYKRVKALSNLVKNNFKATDLMLTAIPVTPTHIRPVIVNEKDNTFINSDLNVLYSNLIVANKYSVPNASNTDSIILPPSETARRSANLYNSVAQLMGKKKALTLKGKTSDVKGILDTLGGKGGVVRNNLLRKRIDFSGRSVIGVDPNLTIDEVALPMDLAKYVYKPFLVKELVRSGAAGNDRQALKMIDKSDPEIKKALTNIANDRPILIGRQPSLHKYGLQAFKPVIKDTEDGSVVRSIHLNPLVTKGFNADFDGDTMYITTPITDKAKEEAKKLMMPSQTMMNPTDGKMVVGISAEMLAGLYLISVGKPKGKVKTYSTYKSLYDDYFSGKVNSDSAVKTPLSPNTISAGQALINWCIPDKVKSKNRQFTSIWGKSEITGLMTNLYRIGEASEWKTISMTEVAEVLDKLKDLGFKASTRAGLSISTSDFMGVSGIEDMYNRRLKETKKTYGNMDAAQIKAWQSVESDIEKQIAEGKLLSKDNNLNIMMRSGAKGNKGQIKKMVATVGVFADIKNNLSQPVKSSFFNGLSPQEYFNQGNEARKGIFDRSVSVVAPGTLSREMWHAAQDVIISEKDCKTNEYITMLKTDPNIRGRYCAANVRSSKKKIICKKGQIIDDAVINAMAKDDSIEGVKVRSPMRCKTVNGCCVKCYGCLPGTLTPVTVGTPVGTLATQALGEPVTQMTMKTFHTGGADSSATLGLQRVQDILNLSDIKNNKAVLAVENGVVSKIDESTNKTIVTIGSKKYTIKSNSDGSNKVLRVKIGDVVRKGDMITLGTPSDISKSLSNKKDNAQLTFANPRQMFDMKKQELGGKEAVKDIQDYLSKSMEYAFGKTVGNDAMNSKHTEIMVGKMTSNVKILDPGNSDYLKGQVVNRNEAEKYNQSIKNGAGKKKLGITNVNGILNHPSAKTYKFKNQVVVKAGQPITKTDISKLKSLRVKNIEVLPKPVVYDEMIMSKNTVPYAGHDNWLSNVGYENINSGLASGAAFGQVDKIDSPKTRLMTGKIMNVGEGFNADKSTVSGFGRKMYNFFAKPRKKK